MSFVSSCLLAGLLLTVRTTAFTGSEYRLSYEYAGLNFFDGWDFYSGRDPTGGFVTYYSRSSAQLTGLIETSEGGPAYMGVNSVDKLPFDNSTGRGDGAGRPSIRIASKQAFTHGLFVGDFAHIPAGICGTWPAFWTLGPNWPYTGEIDILEGVNQNQNNLMSLHTNETCTIEGDSTVMTGHLQNTNCAYYPDYNVGCGVSDSRATSYGIGFNQGDGGVYAMQWTSEAILIWNWLRSEVPADVDNKTPDPGSWGLPAAQLAVGNCSVDQHFQSHKIVFDTTFCGEYAGNANVWKTNDDNSCEAATGLATCDNFVANHPEAFKDAYWSVNYVRVYQLVDPDESSMPSAYIASEQPSNTATEAYTAANAIATPNLDANDLCPMYNYSIIYDGKYQYEIACDVDPPGPDLLGIPYSGFKANSLADCIKGCSYINENNGTNRCGGVSHYAEINFCYFKKYIDGTPVYRKGYNEVRLIYYGYPQITDDPRSVADSTLTSVFVETIPTPQIYRPLTTTSRAIQTTESASSNSTGSSTASLPPALGDNSTSTTSNVPSDYSETVTQSYANATSSPSSVASTTGPANPTVTEDDFYITFNVDSAIQRLKKRAIEFLAFDDEKQSILVTSEAGAAKFRRTADGLLVSGAQYVAIDNSVRPVRFLLQDQKPSVPVTLNVDKNGTVTISGVDGYCLTNDGTLAVVPSSSEVPTDCRSVKPELISAPGNSTNPTSSTSVYTASSSITSSRSLSLSLSSHNTPSTSTSTLGPIDSSTMLTRSSTSALSSPTMPTVNSFVYAGCFGISTASAASLPGISLPLTSDALTVEKCTAACKNLKAYYAAMHEQQCFCGNDVSLYAHLVTYPDSSCNTPCPGANREMCGGDVLSKPAASTSSRAGSIMMMGKRQNADLVLVSLYNNTLLLPLPGGSAGQAETQTDTATAIATATETKTLTMTAMPTSLSGSVSRSISSIFDPATFPIESISYDITGTDTYTVLSTMYVDVCHVCAGGLTTQATTITVPHCGCTASYNAILQATISVPSPSIPMLTTAKQCVCGHEGAQSTITVTVPHQSSISVLQSLVEHIAVHSANPIRTEAVPGAEAIVTGPGAPQSHSNEQEPLPVAPDSPAEASDSLDSDNDSVLEQQSFDTVPMDTNISDTDMAPSIGAYVPPAAASQPPLFPAESAPFANPRNSSSNSNANGNVSSLSSPPNNITLPSGPIQPYTPSSVAAGTHLSRTDRTWMQDRFILSALVGVLLLGMALLW